MAMKRPSYRHPDQILCPTLPPEVWFNVFCYHTDVAHLWLTCRLVSSTFRACAERAFGQHFLQNVRIDFQLEKYNLGGRSQRPEISVIFDHVGRGPESGMAWYKDTREPPHQAETADLRTQTNYDKMTCRWEENVHGRRPEMPNYIISIGDLVNDTDLPGLQIDTKKGEVSFRWREMLHLFFREQGRLYTLKCSWQADASKKIQANNDRVTKGEKLVPSDYPCSWPSAEIGFRKEIRRRRMKEHYQDDERMVWAINSLKHFENYGGGGHDSSKALELNPDIPGASLGEKWFGNLHLVQELYLDEWSCMHRIDTKSEHIRNGR